MRSRHIHGIGDQYVAQYQLQGERGFVVDIDQGVKVTDPDVDRRVQRDDRKDRAGQRKGDRPVLTVDGAAVDFACLKQFRRNGVFKIRPHQDDIPSAHSIGNDHRPNGVTPSEGVVDQKIIGHQAHVEEHGEQHQETR